MGWGGSLCNFRDDQNPGVALPPPAHAQISINAVTAVLRLLNQLPVADYIIPAQFDFCRGIEIGNVSLASRPWAHPI